MRILLKLIFLGIIISCASKREIHIDSSKILNIHFVDDFQNNVISLLINDNQIFQNKFFKKSDIPQQRNFETITVILSEENVKVYEKGQLESQIKLENNIIGSMIILNLKVDKKSIFREINLKKGTFILISYDKGDISIRQSIGFLD